MLNILTSAAISFAFGILSFCLQAVIKENRQLKKKRDERSEKRQLAIEGGILSLLRVKLIEYHDRYMEEGEAPAYVLDNYEKMFDSYEELGGNGMIKKMHEDMQKLPTR